MRPENMRQFALDESPEDQFPLWIKIAGFLIGKAVRHWRGLIGVVSLLILLW